MRRWQIVAAACTVAACGTEPGQAPPPPPPPTAPEIIRPELVEAISLELVEHTLPAALAQDASLTVTASSGVTLVGATSGLYTLDSTGFTQVHPSAVASMVAFEGLRLVANAQGLYVHGSTLTRSPINDALEQRTVTALAVQGRTLWIGTNQGLYAFEAGQLSSFDDSVSVASISTFEGASLVSVTLTDGAHHIFRDESGQWTRQVADAEVMLDRVVAGAGARAIGSAGGDLVQRVSLADDQLVWRPVATDSGDMSSGATSVEALATDPTSGAVWSVGAVNIDRLEITGDRVSKIGRPVGLGPVIATSVTHDGALWLTDGATLRRIDSSGGPVTFSNAVSAFSKANCESCHVDLGRAPMALVSYDDWVRWVDALITRVENNTMPPGGTGVTMGTVDTLRQWRADGLRR